MWRLSLAWLALLGTTSTSKLQPIQQSNWLTESPVPLSSAPAPPLQTSLPTVVTESVHLTSTTSQPVTTEIGLVVNSTITTEGSLALNLSTSASLTSETEDEYYQAYQDYPDPINSSGSLLPALELSRAKVDTGSSNARTIIRGGGTGEDEEEEVSLPEDSLADTDLHDHDLIDSVMYIYYGGGGSGSASGRPSSNVGLLPSGMTGSVGGGSFSIPTVQPPHNIQVVIVGAVVALVAQFLTLASALRRVRSKDPSLLVLLNTELALTLTNLLFMLGVQATSDTRTCGSVAVGLHFLHLVTAATFTGTSFYCYARLACQDTKPLLMICVLGAWLLPAPAVYLCTLVNWQCYELHNYCWLSLDKGFLASFVLPVSLLIVASTVMAVLGLRPSVLRSDKCPESTLPSPEMAMPSGISVPNLTDSLRRDLRLSAILLPAFSVVWCLSLLALSNTKSLLFPLLFVAINAFLNWFVYIWWLPGEGSSWRSDGDLDDIEDDLEEDLLYDEPVTTKDDQALLQDYFIGKRICYDPPIEPISTISS